jgi:GH15 family glucan-1,4-alpha-glucosidase
LQTADSTANQQIRHHLIASRHLWSVPLHGNQPCKIGDYGVIGDCRSAALVSRFGSIDWLCWPLFDSPSIFAAILDPKKGGHWSIRPADPYQVERAYIKDTNVLETTFTGSAGEATLIDLMPVSSEAYKREALVPDHQIIRVLRCTSGEVKFDVDFYPRAKYGLKSVSIRGIGKLGLRMKVGRGAYWLRSTVPLQRTDHRASGSFSLKEGDVVFLSLSYSEESPTVLPALGKGCEEAVERSIHWWQQWTARAKYEGPYREAVTRSALALKSLCYAPSGAVVAAATTSLPERIGSHHNWDYRFCWLRDASLTIRSLLGLGYIDEAESFLTWLLHGTRLTYPKVMVMYTVFGRKSPPEYELPQLTGYCGSRPVRIGNGARDQLQLDIYGEVVESTAQYADYMGGFDLTTQRALIGLGKYVAEHWDEPDEGIWEPRSGRVNHTNSRLMCWTALDRLLALGEKGRLQNVPREWFTRERDRMRAQIEQRAWNEDLQSYVATLDGDDLDATLLRLAWYGFEHADSKRMKSTYQKIREELGAGNDLLYRYKRTPPEGAFGICGFWGVEQLALAGSLREAHRAFQNLAQYGNDLGLFAEEIDPQTGDALGNFPQAFTHVGLISAALTLAEQERGQAQPAIQVGSDVKPSRSEATK